MMFAIAPPADRPVTKTRAGSSRCCATAAATAFAIDAASPPPRRLSPVSNQLKQPLALLARTCSGNSSAKPCAAASADQPAAAS
jgi:hypothetical protein